MRGCVARARSDLSLKFLANGTVDRIRAAAADRDDQACSADQEHILVSAARCITPGQGHHQQAISISMASAAAKNRVTAASMAAEPAA